MKEAYVNAVLQPAKTVWWRLLNSPLLLARAEIEEVTATSEEVTAAVQVSGQLNGTVMYGFDGNAVKSVSRKVLEWADGHSTVSRLDPADAAQSAISQVAAMITREAAASLDRAGYECTLSQPSFLGPRGSSLGQGATRMLGVLFRGTTGNLHIRLDLQEAPAAVAVAA